MRTPEEQNLLEKLASGSLDGMVGDEREYRRYRSIYCGRIIRNGIPVFYRQQVPSVGPDGRENTSSHGTREEEVYESDEQKLEFLRRFGWLMEDEDARAYSSRFKPGHKSNDEH